MSAKVNAVTSCDLNFQSQNRGDLSLSTSSDKYLRGCLTKRPSPPKIQGPALVQSRALAYY